MLLQWIRKSRSSVKMTWRLTLINIHVLCLLHSMFICVTNAVTGETGVTPLVSLVTDDVVDTDIGPSLLTESSLRLDSVAPDCCLALSLSLSAVWGRTWEPRHQELSAARQATRDSRPGPVCIRSSLSTFLHLEGTLFSCMYWPNYVSILLTHPSLLC